MQLSTNRVGIKRHHVAQAQLLSRRETMSAKLQRDREYPGTRVSPQKKPQRGEARKGEFGSGIAHELDCGIACKRWIVELHAITITEHPGIHKSDCLLPDYYTHGWLRQLPVSPLHSLTARDDKIRWRICITLKNSRL
jgi:hypothetical protein